MKKELEKTYNPADIEPRLYEKKINISMRKWTGAKNLLRL